MGNDLVSACVFCAGLLLGVNAAPWGGLSSEIGISYATAARSADAGPGRRDLSDVTPKFVLIGAGGARETAPGSGAGTPAAEWRLRVALAPSHDEQSQTPFSTSNVTATGTGRYENFALLARYPIGPSDSIEAGWNRRTHKATDLVAIGGERRASGEERTLSAERVDVGLGLRHRWAGFEAAISARAAHPSGSMGTSATFRIAESWLWGAGAEVRARRGPWTVWARGERHSGTIDTHEESAPDFPARDASPRASLEDYEIGGLYAAGSTDVSLSAALDRTRLPFVAFAPLGLETAALEQGLHPDSTSRQVFGTLSVRRRVGRAVRVRAFLRLGYGDETVRLSDPADVRSDQRIDVKSSGVFGSGLSRALGSPQVTLGLGAEFKLD